MAGLGTALALLVAPSFAAGQLLAPGTRPEVSVTVGKPLMGENYDAFSGLFWGEVRLPHWPTAGIIVRGGFAYSTSGLARSTTLANPAVGFWARPGGIPVEGMVSLPLRKEMGDDDFATDLALLSDPIHRERYASGGLGITAAVAPHIVFRDGSTGDLKLGLVAITSHGSVDTDVRARYEAGLALGFSRSVQAGGRFAGTMRMTGSGGFDQRVQHELQFFLRLTHAPGFPEISFRLPIDIDLQDYVTGVVGLQVRF